MPEQVTIPARFNGPRQSANGGYAAGVIAGLLGGPAEASLRRPVPLDRALTVARDDGAVRLLDGDEVIADGRATPDFALDVPEGIGVEQARQAGRGYRAPADGEFSTCFVCGRARHDALGVFAGPVPGRDLVASAWTPGEHLAAADGTVAAEIVWAVLDCPTYFALYSDDLPMSFLARMTGRIDGPVCAGEDHIVIAWPIAFDGRKHYAGSAVLTAAGEVVARAHALLIGPREA
jgi:hypothetical protein